MVYAKSRDYIMLLNDPDVTGDCEDSHVILNTGKCESSVQRHNDFLII